MSCDCHTPSPVQVADQVGPGPAGNSEGPAGVHQDPPHHRAELEPRGEWSGSGGVCACLACVCACVHVCMFLVACACVCVMHVWSCVRSFVLSALYHCTPSCPSLSSHPYISVCMNRSIPHLFLPTMLPISIIFQLAPSVPLLPTGQSCTGVQINQLYRVLFPPVFHLTHLISLLPFCYVLYMTLYFLLSLLLPSPPIVLPLSAHFLLLLLHPLCILVLFSPPLHRGLMLRVLPHPLQRPHQLQQLPRGESPRRTASSANWVRVDLWPVVSTVLPWQQLPSNTALCSSMRACVCSSKLHIHLHTLGREHLSWNKRVMKLDTNVTSFHIHSFWPLITRWTFDISFRPFELPGAYMEPEMNKRSSIITMRANTP